MKADFKFFSFGMVYLDKEKGSPIIKTFPIEHMASYAGELGTKKKIKTEMDVEKYSKQKFDVELEQIIDATWIPIGQSNRLTPPDASHGETVMLYKYGESNIIFWDTIGNESDLRKKEHIRMVYSNTSKFKEHLTPKNTYWQSVDCFDKFVKVIHTSDNDGELTTFDIDIQTEKGVLSVYDGRGNYIRLNSADDSISVKANKTVNITTETVNVKCNTYNLECDDMNTYVKNNTNFDTNTQKSVIRDSHTEEVANTYSIKAKTMSFKVTTFLVETKDFLIKSTTTSIKAATATIKASSITLKGLIGLKGVVSASPPISTGATAAKT